MRDATELALAYAERLAEILPRWPPARCKVHRAPVQDRE